MEAKELQIHVRKAIDALYDTGSKVSIVFAKSDRLKVFRCICLVLNDNNDIVCHTGTLCKIPRTNIGKILADKKSPVTLEGV